MPKTLKSAIAFFALLASFYLATCTRENEQRSLASPFAARGLTSDCAALPTGLIHWWPGECDARDAQGNAHGSLRNGATFGEGKVEQAFLFDGVDDFIDLGNDTSLHFSSSEFTLALWIKFNSLGQNCGGYDNECVRGILAKMLRVHGRGTGEDGWYLAKVNDNGLSFSLGGGVGKNGSAFWRPTTVSSTTTVKGGRWYHLAVVKSASAFALYVNGREEESKPLPAFTDTHATSMKFGAYAPEYNQGEEGAHFAGLIDEVQIYLRGLSASEIETLYDARSNGACNVTLDVLPNEPANFLSCGNADEIIPVAILSTSTAKGEHLNFDAATVALASARFGPKAASEIPGGGHLEDVDNDGDLDLLLNFRFSDTGIKAGDQSTNLLARTKDGLPLRGCDKIRTPDRVRKVVKRASPLSDKHPG